jgi:hypothetical protein
MTSYSRHRKHWLTRAELPEGLPEAETAPRNAEVLGDPLSIDDVAALVGCSAWTVRQKLLPRGLPHFRCGRGGRLIFYRQQVIRWIVRHQRLQGGTP